jgi:hypothetical protein
MSSIPAAVKQAIENWTDTGPFRRKPVLSGETSFIFDWGVRVEYEEGNKPKIAFICMADEFCRSADNGTNLLLLSKGRTSAAVKHLRLVHHLESPKTKKESKTKRKRNADIEHLRSSTMYARNPARLNVLLETLRIINHNLPLCICEYEESRLLEALVKKEEMKVIITAERIGEAVIELYSSTRKEVIEFFENNKAAYPNFTMMADFWTCKTTSKKYLGLRVYLIDNNWQLRSLLLGTRKFSPSYGDRDKGIRKPFLLWMKRALEDFGLTTSNFFGATSDKGADVRCLLTEELQLQWEWCMAHMAHAATRAACGMNASKTQENPEMTELISQLTTTIYQVRTVEVTGDLFEALCMSKTETSTTRLLNYSSARFLSITNAIRRVLEKWPALVEWFAERARKAVRDKTRPPVFPLAGREQDLCHVLSVLTPVAELKRACQAEAPNQVDVLMMLYKLRLTDLNNEKPVRHYLSTDKNPRWIEPNELTPLAKSTRLLLRDAFDKRFFCRYYDASKMAKTSYVFEMQQKLHPIFKSPRLNLNTVILLVCKQQGFGAREACDKRDKVHERIRDQLRALLNTVADPSDAVEAPAPPPSPVPYYSELEAMFAPPPRRSAVVTVNQLQRRVDEELDRWKDDSMEIERSESGAPESVLSFWQRVEHRKHYIFLPRAVKVLFAIPASSCQIQR